MNLTSRIMNKVLFISTTIIYTFALLPEKVVGYETSDLEIDVYEGENQILSEKQNNFKFGFGEIITFFDSINTTLKNLEMTVVTLDNKVDIIEKNFRNSTNTFDAATINERLRRVECQKAPDATCLQWLVEPKMGTSFKGKSLEEISRAIPGKTTLAIQIKNFIDTSLSSYTLYIPRGQDHTNTPDIINAKTKEVFTFKDKENFAPDDSFLYLVDSTDIALHVHFYSDVSTRILAKAFLRNLYNPQMLHRITPEKNVTSNSAGISTTTLVGKTGEAIIQSISESSLFAKSTFGKFDKQ